MQLRVANAPTLAKGVGAPFARAVSSAWAKAKPMPTDDPSIRGKPLLSVK